MSITDDQKEIINLGTVHSWAFKIWLYVGPAFALWAITTILRHDTDIAVLKMQISMMGGGKVSQSVNVGQTETAEAEMTSIRDYLTTADIATRENVSERTVTQWINEGRLDPLPEKAGESWAIAKNVRILPQDAVECGEVRK